MEQAQMLAKLERAMDRSRLGECPGNPDEDKREECSLPSLAHAVERTTAIVCHELIAAAEDEDPEGQEIARIIAAAMTLGLLEHSRTLGAAVLSGITAAAADPEWGQAVAAAFRRGIDAIEFSGEANLAAVDMSAALRKWLNP